MAAVKTQLRLAVVRTTWQERRDWSRVGLRVIWALAGCCAPCLRLTPCLSLRVYGSYEHLWAGQVADALVDLTGGLAERWSLKDLASSVGQRGEPGTSEPRTCRQLLGLKERCPISCSVFSPRAGEATVRGLGMLTGTCQGSVEGRTFVLPSWCPGCVTLFCLPFSRGRGPFALDQDFPTGQAGACGPRVRSAQEARGGPVSGSAGSLQNRHSGFPSGHAH